MSDNLKIAVIVNVKGIQNNLRQVIVLPKTMTVDEFIQNTRSTVSEVAQGAQATSISVYKEKTADGRRVYDVVWDLQHAREHPTKDVVLLKDILERYCPRLDGIIEVEVSLKEPPTESKDVYFMGWEICDIDGELDEAACETCGIPARFQCATCKDTRYCSFKCQDADFDDHKEICEPIKEEIGVELIGRRGRSSHHSSHRSKSHHSKRHHKRGGMPSSHIPKHKACKMAHEHTIKNHPITRQQQKMFWARCKK